MIQVSGDEAKAVIKKCRGKASARYGPLALYINDGKVAICTVLSDWKLEPTEEQKENLKRLFPEIS